MDDRANATRNFIRIGATAHMWRRLIFNDMKEHYKLEKDNQIDRRGTDWSQDKRLQDVLIRYEA